MNQNMKRIVVWILLASLLIGIVPVVALTAFADGETLEHSPKEAWAYDDNKHWHECTVEGCEEHSGENAYNYGNHEYNVADFTQEKTGEANTYYYTCVCGKVGTETYKAYTVTFATEHGTVTPAQKTVKSGNPITAPTAPEETGWRFDGWKNDEQEWDFGTEITEDVTLTAKWTQVFTVTAGEKVSVSAATAAKDETITVTVTPDTGYTVNTVTVTPEGGTAFEAVKSGDSYTFTMPEKNVTVAASFKLSALTVSPTTVPLLYVGGTATLSVTPANEEITWSSDKEDVATVANGVVTAHKAGSATITATANADNTVKTTCTVQVKNIAFTAESKTLSGKKESALTSGTTLALTLTDGALVETASAFTAANVVVTNCPAGITYTVARTDEKTITLTFTGTPTEAKDGALQITVSRELVQNAPAGDAVTVTANTNTKWEIKDTHTVTIATMATAHGSAALLDAQTRYTSGETVTVVPTVNAPFRVKSVTVSPTATVTKTSAGYTFPMGDADVTVTVHVETIPITTDIAEKSHVGSISLTNAAGLAEAIRTGSSSVKVNTTLTDSQKTAIADGRYSFKFTIGNSGSTADNTALRERAVTKDGMHLVYNAYNDLTYFDISLSLTTYKENGTVDGAVIGVTDTGSYKATITFPNLDRSPAKRLYYIHAGHDVKNYLAQSSSSTNGNIVFDNLSQFSTYTLVRTSVESPQTGDRFPLGMLLTVFIVSSMGLTAMIGLRKIRKL